MDWQEFNQIIEQMSSGRVQQALEALERLQKTEEDPLNLGVLLMETTNGLRLQGRFSEARVAIKKALNLFGPALEYSARAAFISAAIEIDSKHWVNALNKLNSVLTSYESVLR